MNDPDCKRHRMIDQLEMERVARWTGQKLTPEQFNAQLESERITMKKARTRSVAVSGARPRQDYESDWLPPFTTSPTEVAPRLPTPTKRSNK